MFKYFTYYYRALYAYVFRACLYYQYIRSVFMEGHPQTRGNKKVTRYSSSITSYDSWTLSTLIALPESRRTERLLCRRLVFNLCTPSCYLHRILSHTLLVPCPLSPVPVPLKPYHRPVNMLYLAHTCHPFTNGDASPRPYLGRFLHGRTILLYFSSANIALTPPE